MLKIIKLGITIGFFALLSACGGGDADSDAPSTEGFWSGSNQAGEDFLMVVLPSNDAWYIALQNDELNYIVQGTSRLNGPIFSLWDAKRLTLDPWQLSSTLLSGEWLSEDSIRVGSNKLQYDSTYDTPLTISAIKGDYQFTGISRFGTTPDMLVSVDSSGQVNVANFGNCTATGTAIPTGKAVVSIEMTFAGSGCELGNGTSTKGILIYENEDRVLVSFSLTASRNDAFIAIGTRL